MKAKDTAMELKQVTEIRTAYPANEVSKAQMIADQKKINEQAELSFKAGIREVVDWVEEEGVMYQYPDTLARWQTKLEEWELQ